MNNANIIFETSNNSLHCVTLSININTLRILYSESNADVK